MSLSYVFIYPGFKNLIDLWSVSLIIVISNWLIYEEKQKFSMERGVVSDTCFKKKHIEWQNM